MNYEQAVFRQKLQKVCGKKLVERMPDCYRITFNDNRQATIGLKFLDGLGYEKLPILYRVK